MKVDKSLKKKISYLLLFAFVLTMLPLGTVFAEESISSGEIPENEKIIQEVGEKTDIPEEKEKKSSEEDTRTEENPSSEKKDDENDEEDPAISSDGNEGKNNEEETEPESIEKEDKVTNSEEKVASEEDKIVEKEEEEIGKPIGLLALPEPKNTKENQIVYIVTDQEEALTKDKYQDEYGEVIVTNHILKIFEEVRYDKTKYLTKEEAENQDLIVILEKDIDFKEEVANAGYNKDRIDYKTLEIHDNLKSFTLKGKEKQRKIHFNFLTQSVKTEIDNINIGTSIVTGGYGYDVDLTIKNSYINYIRGIDFSEKEHPSKKKSKINIKIENSTIDEMIGVHGADNKVADYTYEFDFKIDDSKISKFLGCITLIPDGDYLDIAENKVKIDHVNITSTNTDFQHFNGVLNAQGSAGMGAEVGDVNINLDNIKVGKIEGMTTSYPYYEGYITAIMDSTNTMADYSFGDINFSMNNYSIEKALIPFIFTSMNPREANVNINKMDFKLKDGGDKEMGKADHYIIGYLGMRKEIEEYKDLIHPINFNVAEGINVELEKVLASSVYLFNSYSERNQTPKNMSINSNININVNEQERGMGVYYIGLGANTGFNGDIVYNYAGDKFSNGNYFDMKSRKDPGNRFGEYLEENQSGARTLIYNPENIVKGENVYTGKLDTLGVITGFQEIHLSTPLIIFGSNNLKQYAEGMKETKLVPLTPYKVENNSIVEGEWNLGDQLILVSPMAGEVLKDTFIQGWAENPPYNLDYFPTPKEDIPTFWFLTVNVTLHGNGGKFKDGEYDFYEIHVSDEGKKLEDYLQESDTDNYFELDGEGNKVLDNEGKPIDLKPVYPEEGFEFEGWTISEDGSLEDEEAKREDFNEETVFTKNIHLYAKWKDTNRYELKGKNAVYTVADKVDEDKLREDIIDLATKNDKSAESTVEIEFLDEGINIQNLTEKAGTYKIRLKLSSKTADVKVTVEEASLYEVIFDANGGAFKDGNEVRTIKDIEEGTKLKKEDIELPSRDSYDFLGWYKEADKNTLYHTEDIIEVPIDENKKVLASWKAKSSSGGGSGGGYHKDKTQDMFIAETDKESSGSYKNAEVRVEDSSFDENLNFTIQEYKGSRDEPINKDKEKNLSEIYFVEKDKPGELKKDFEIALKYDKENLKKDDQVQIYRWNDAEEKWEALESISDNRERGIIIAKSREIGKFVVRINAEKLPSDLEDHWSKEAMLFLKNKGCIVGYPDGTIRPEQNITRAEFASVIVCAFELEKRTGKKFADTKDHWAREKIETANAHGVLAGYNLDEFGPNDTITREQIASMLVNTLKLAKVEANKDFVDSEEISAWARLVFETAITNDLVSGYEDQTLRPKNYATRAEAVAFIYKALQKK